MKNIVKRIIVGIIIGLVLMCARKYLFINASAMTTSSISLDTYRFTNSLDEYHQVNYSGKNANLPTSTIGSSNAGFLRYFFHSNENMTISSGSTLYFSIGTSLMYNDGNDTHDFLNSSFSIGTNGTLVGSNGNRALCEVVSTSSDLDTIMTYKPTKETSSGTAVYSPYYFVQEFHNNDFRFVQTYKCTLDEDITFSTTTNTASFISPNMMYGYGPWGFYSRGYSDIQIVNGFESIIINNQQATENAINNVNNTLSDSSTDDPDNAIDDMNDSVATNGTISQLLTLPIQLYQNILNSVSGSCSSFNLGNLLGTTLLLPCINLQQLLGSTLYGVIDVLCSGLFILSFRKKMVDIFNHMTSLNDRGNELER